MANTPGFTVDLNRYEIPDKAKFVTQDRGGRVVFWADRPKTYLDGGAWTGSYLKTLCTGPVNPGWQNAIIKWPLRDPGGQKHDSEKTRLDLLFSGCPDALTEVAQVLTHGAVKYGEHNWKRVDDADKRYLAAGGRHELAYQKGHPRDPESGHHHLAHEACCVLFRLQRALELGE